MEAAMASSLHAGAAAKPTIAMTRNRKRRIPMPITRRMLMAGLAFGACFPLASRSIAQMDTSPFKVVAFAGASNWPFWVGQEEGFFGREGLSVVLELTPNSVELARNLHNGRYDLALTSVDNIVAYDEGQGEADLGGPADFVAIFGVDSGLLSVMAVPEVKSFADLKGKTLSVDAMTTGFAFVLRELLARNGVSEGDVQIVRVGGGAQRLEALLKKEQAATLLNTPLDLVAEAKGFNRLARARDQLGAYQGIVAAMRRDRAKEQKARVEAFIRGFHASVAWLADAANRDKAVTLLTGKMRGMERASAERAYEKLLDPAEGIYRDLRIDREGLATVLRLRSTYAPARKLLTDPDRYIDPSYLAAALNRT
jgi:ABC-type nitrate/sulfonate/bicarbonate transport system substrate-binding protein